MPQEYKHLDAHTRCIVFILREEGLTLRAIAARTHVHHATISRELKRNVQAQGVYCYKNAQKLSVSRRHFASRRHSKMNQEGINRLVLGIKSPYWRFRGRFNYGHRSQRRHIIPCRQAFKIHQTAHSKR